MLQGKEGSLIRVCRTATHCNALQHAATHCNTLQPAATHCRKIGLFVNASRKGRLLGFRV